MTSTRRRQKAAALHRQGGKCAYCDRGIRLDGPPPMMATWDHIVPRSRGGTLDADNRVLACVPCNAAKRDTPVHIFAPGFRRPPRSPIDPIVYELEWTEEDDAQYDD